MAVKRALQLVDSLVTPVALYSAEVLAVLSLPKKSFDSKESLLKAWETFLPEKLNQRACRMVLSVHKKSSRLAVLGELGRYPLLIKGLVQTINYDWHVKHKTSNNSLVKCCYNEMLSIPDSWLSRVESIKKLLNLTTSPIYVSKDSVAKQTKTKLNGIFDRFWLDQINLFKNTGDNTDHNKLRFYKTLKGCFKAEPYLDLVQNRNQRSSLTRLRISAHSLEVERLRYQTPAVPYCERYCRYCTQNVPGDEKHFLMFCETFMNKRQCFLGKMKSLFPAFSNLSNDDIIKFILCPTTPQSAKLVNKYISIMIKARDNIDDGIHVSNLTFPPHVENYTCHDISLDESIYSNSSCESLSSESDPE